MPLLPPSGWVEIRPEDDDLSPAHVRFHSRPDCPRVGDPANLRRVDKPYSATRCMLCASESNEPTPHPTPAGSRPAMSA
jgi:hypothetical protein